MTATVVHAPGLDDVPAAVEAALEEFLDGKARTGADDNLRQFTELLRGLLSAGGKRLRPVLCCCGWLAAGGGDLAPVVPAAASLELFHTFALIHDDIMDRSDTRRGHPTVHRTLAARVCGRLGLLDAESFGVNGAILLGDLAMVWSDELLHAGGLSSARLAAARPVLDAMRSEVMYGQYLDLLISTDLDSGLEASLTVARYKTAKYTVERPLQLGAALADGDERTLEACSAYGLPLGEAFQLRDDVLGVFGDPSVTGKPRLDDLRAGKHTALLAIALQQADRAQARVLRALVGDPRLDEYGAAAVRGVLRTTGALDTVERMIRERRQQAVDSLERSPFPQSVRAALYQLATAVTVRTS
ncbi:polyprenyl synthetase family protein [Streptomyces yerevanensis]|uniref:polyprenyl synthetase family protein n=1 Tax=Streptomyces yerevanensis TaxID=66378 RepID=UPI000527731C|nr:polyprenyl synthetase family protein [Streptomyces yerevanensis]